MSQLDDTLTDLVQAWADFMLKGESGDGAQAIRVTKQQIKELILELADECTVKGGEYAINGKLLYQKVDEL